MEKHRKIIIDTDPGVDDAIAILLAHAWFRAEDILCVTTTAGNVGIEATTRNALGLKKLIGASYEVYRGADRPLRVHLSDASHIHGDTGMGQYTFDETASLSGEEKAWDALYRIAKREGGITVIALGPLTNIARALEKYPDLGLYIDEIYSMGGSTGKGNRTPFSEFNYYCDPHAAERVFSAGLNLFMVGLNVTETAYADSRTMGLLQPEERRLNEFVTSLKNYYRGTLSDPMVSLGYHIPDAVAVASCIDPSVCVFEDMSISIVTEEGEKQGMSLHHAGQSPPVHVAVDVDVKRFRELLLCINALNA